jgi:hypothetical protein
MQLPPRSVTAGYLENLAAMVDALRDRDADLVRDLIRNLMSGRETPRPFVAVEA